MIRIDVSSKNIDISAVLSQVMRKDCGGIASFVGTIRDVSEGKKVKRVEVEAYDEMAISDLRKIAEVAVKKNSARSAVIQHRTGKLEVGDVVVVIAVSAPHRNQAFDACREIIDHLKKTTPIWKQEFFEDSSRWVEGK